MDKQQLAELLTATFVAELDERVQALDHDLLALEKRPSPGERSELFKTLFRSAHSLKGAARSVSVSIIESACHCLEEVLTGVRDGRLSLESDLFGLLFAAVDAIQEAGARLREHRDLGGTPLETVLPQLEQVAKGETPAAEVKIQPAEADITAPAAASPAPIANEAQSAPPLEAEKPVSTPPLPAAAPRPKAPAAAPTPAAASVRVAAEKLDSLLTQSGELLVARRRVESRAADLEELREMVAAWVTQWRSLEGPLRSWAAELNDHVSIAGPAGRTPKGLSPRACASVLEEGNRLRRLEKDLEHLSRKMRTDSRALGQAGTLLESEVHRVRMLPFGEGCQGLERAVRDVARASGKEVELVLQGEEVEVDRSILEGLRDPLLHLVRNAVDHGVEPPARRQAAGKSAVATITVSAALRGSQIEVVVGDDGGGLNLEAIRAQALKRNLPVPQDDRELARVLFLPGFSTAPVITEVSGRGVGLDVVQSRIESLRGSVEVKSEPGQGTRFILTVPLTLTTIAALLVRAAGQTLALADTSVRSLVRFGADAVRRIGGREVLLWDDTPLALASLAGTLGLPQVKLPSADRNAPEQAALAVIVSAGDKRAAFLVDEVLEEQTIVVKSLGSRIRRVRHVSGATLLPSGAIALLLNAANLVEDVSAGGSTRTQAVKQATALAPTERRLLVAEDSLTTRTLMKSILESHGYQVVTAADGQEAWDRLQEIDFHLVVSDIEMPRMDGFSLTAAIRGSKRLAKTPVILVTALAADKDKARGIEVGADAYLVKSGFDQTHLLETIGQLL